MTVTFDDLRHRLLKEKRRLRWFPWVTTLALEAALYEWPQDRAPRGELFEPWLLSKAKERGRFLASHLRYGSIWVMILIEALKIIIPLLIDWLNRSPTLLPVYEELGSSVRAHYAIDIPDSGGPD